MGFYGSIGDSIVLPEDTAISQSVTLRTGMTFSVENDAELYLAENTSMMNCSNSAATVYYDGDAYTVKAEELFTAYVNCINNGSLIGEDVAFFMGNPSYGEGNAITDVYVTGFVNYGELRGTKTARAFSKGRL